MDRKWTPGPWVCEYGVDGYFYLCEPGAAEIPCNAYNAHLIAAAPDLYEALEECANDLAEWVEISDSPKTAQRLEHALAALAKARGEA